MASEKAVLHDRVSFLLNGEPQDAPAGTTVSELLDRLELPPDKVAVELNREIVRQGRRESTVIHAGSSLEIVEFVGGG